MTAYIFIPISFLLLEFIINLNHIESKRFRDFYYISLAIDPLMIILITTIYEMKYFNYIFYTYVIVRSVYFIIVRIIGKRLYYNLLISRIKLLNYSTLRIGEIRIRLYDKYGVIYKTKTIEKALVFLKK